MGTVYEAVDIEHGTPVALKTLSELEPDALLRFKQEFRQAADLSHPNLVSLYELSCDEGLWFFTMERVDGADFVAALGERSTFRSVKPSVQTETRGDTVTINETGPARTIQNELRIREPDPLPPEAVEQLRERFSQLVQAVLALHRAQLLHLDIKPGNILVEPSGRVVLLDFGVSRSVDAFEARGSTDDVQRFRRITGTPAWMAPEQHAGDPLDAAADWYAVGLVLYAALTGVHPFQLVSGAALGQAKRISLPAAPHERVDAPEDLSKLAMALLSPAPADRPGDEQMAAWVLEDHQAFGSDSAARRTFVGRAEERHRAIAAFDAAAAGGAGIVRICGPSGVGKSALSRELRSHAVAGGALALHGRCYERESVPFKAFDAMLDDLARELSGRDPRQVEALLPPGIAELARVFPAIASVPAVRRRVESLDPVPNSLPAAELHRRAVDALRALFVALASDVPCLLEIDDLQWADRDSVYALQRLVKPPLPRHLLLVLTYRDREARANGVVARFLRSDPLARGETLALGPLDAREATSLARAVLGDDEVSQAVIERIVVTADGSPLFIEELANLASSQLESTGALDLHAVIARRVAALGPDEHSLIEVLSVANNPIPVAVAVRAAGLSERGVIRALWTLRRLDFVRSSGASRTDTIEVRHDRLREAVGADLDPEVERRIHAALGRELSEVTNELTGERPWLFDATRHLNLAADLLDPEWRRRAAELDLQAGRRARRATAFDLAYACFDAGAGHLDALGPEVEMPLRVALHEGAAEAAYLSSRWDEMQRHVAAVKLHTPEPLDRLGVYETEIDAHIARNAYGEAVDVGVAALDSLGVTLPADPDPGTVEREFKATFEALSELGPEGLETLDHCSDQRWNAVTRLESRITSAAYFGRPNLLPVLGFRMVQTSLAHGLSPATAYGLSIFGIVLNTVELYEQAHTWGTLAMKVLDQFDDRRLAARTGHVVHDLVCNFVVPLRDTLPKVLGVFETGKALGDVEYAAYAAHAYIHSAMYSGLDLQPLLTTAAEFSEFMRGYDQVNAHHVHEPFEALLRSLTGQNADPARLDGHGYSEAASLAAAEAAGSRSAMCLNRVVIGLARFHFASAEETSEVFEAARPYLDGMPSVWHTPIFHQHASLAILALPAAERTPLMAYVDESLAALNRLAEAAPFNFAHRVAMIEARRARVDGDARLGLTRAADAIALAREHRWTCDLGTALLIAARCHAALGDPLQAQAARAEAREVYKAWGATALAEHVA